MNDKSGQTPLTIKIAYRVEQVLFKLGEFACWLRGQHTFISSPDSVANDKFCVTCKMWKSQMNAD